MLIPSNHPQYTWRWFATFTNQTNSATVPSLRSILSSIHWIDRQIQTCVQNIPEFVFLLLFIFGEQNTRIFCQDQTNYLISFFSYVIQLLTFLSYVLFVSMISFLIHFSPFRVS